MERGISCTAIEIPDWCPLPDYINSKPSEILDAIKRTIIDKELIPTVALDSGRAEWTDGEAQKLAEAIAHSLTTERDTMSNVMDDCECLRLRVENDKLKATLKLITKVKGGRCGECGSFALDEAKTLAEIGLDYSQPLSTKQSQ